MILALLAALLLPPNTVNAPVATIPLDFVQTQGTVAIQGYDGSQGQLKAVHISVLARSMHTSLIHNLQSTGPCHGYMGTNRYFPEIPHDSGGVSLIRHDGTRISSSNVVVLDTSVDLAPAGEDGDTALMVQYGEILFTDVAILTDAQSLQIYRRQTVQLSFQRFGQQTVSSDCGKGAEQEEDMSGADVIVTYETIPPPPVPEDEPEV